MGESRCKTWQGIGHLASDDVMAAKTSFPNLQLEGCLVASSFKKRPHPRGDEASFAFVNSSFVN